MGLFDHVSPDIKILVVDDFSTMRRIVRNTLRQIGFHDFVEADDGKNALAKLENNDAIKFIVSDWNMPNMMGIDLLRAVRANEQLKDLPFLMVTAEAEKANVVEAVKAGVSNYVIKPFTAETLLAKVEAIFKK